MIAAGDLDLRPPFPGESLDGFVADIAGDNGLGKVRCISGAGGVAHAHRPNLATTCWSNLPALATLLEIGVEELRHRSYPFVDGAAGRRAFFGTTIHQQDLRTRTRFFSPGALALSPHHRAMWQLRLPYDWQTGELLISTCPRPWCGKVQRWRHSAGVRFCDSCVKDLSEQQVPSIDDDLLPAYRLAAGLTHTDRKIRATSLAALPAEIASLGADVAFELLTRLAPVANARCEWSPATRIWGNEAPEIAKAMHGAWHILRGWPGSLAGRVEQDLANGRKRHDDGNGGANRRFLVTRKADGLPDTLRQLIERFKASLRLDGPNAGRLRADTLTAVEASAMVRIGTKELVELRRAGRFRTLAALRGALLTPLFERAEVEEVAVGLRSRLELNSVNDRLGLPYYAVEMFAARGHFPPPAHPFFKDRYVSPQTTRPALDAFVALLDKGQSAQPLDGEPVKALMRMVGGRAKPWGVVLDAMLAGELPYSLDTSAAATFDGVRVQRQALRLLLGIGLERPAPIDSGTTIGDGPRPGPLITKRDCAELLNLTGRVVGELLRDYPTSPNAIVPLADAEALARRYVSTAELAARLDATIQDVQAAARTLGIQRGSAAGFNIQDDAALAATIVAATRNPGRARPAA